MMNRNTLVMMAAFLGMVIGSLLSTAVAQSSMFDPAIVAPHIYETALENARIRVLKSHTRNGETPPLHSHPDRVTVFLTSCAWMESSDDGRSQMESYSAGDVIWHNRVTHGGETSNVVHDCIAMEIELKDN